MLKDAFYLGNVCQSRSKIGQFPGVKLVSLEEGTKTFRRCPLHFALKSYNSFGFKTEPLSLWFVSFALRGIFRARLRQPRSATIIGKNLY